MFKAVKDISALMVGTVIGTLFGLITTIILARILGPEIYGNYQVITSITFFFVMLFSFGIDEAAFYFSSKDKNKKKVIKNSITLKTIFSLLGFLVLLIISPLINRFYQIDNLEFYIRFFGLEIILYSLFTNITSNLEGLSLFKKSAITNIVFNVLRVVIIVPLALFFGLAGALIGRLGSWVITVLVGFFFLRKYFGFSIEKDSLKKMFKYSFPIYISIFFKMLGNRFPILFLGTFGSREVGIFSAAFLIYTNISVMINAFLRVGIQRIANKDSDKEKKLVYDQLKKYVAIFSSFIIFIIIPFSTQIVNIIFGNEYIEAVNPLRIITIGMLLYSTIAPANSYAFGSGKTKTIRNVVILQALTTVTSGFFLISKFGLLGAAFTVFITQIVGMFAYTIFERKNKLNGRINLTLKSIISGAIMALLLFVIVNLFGTVTSIIVGAIVGPLFFFMSIYLFRILNEQDFDIAEKVLGMFKINVKNNKIWVSLKKHSK